MSVDWRPAGTQGRIHAFRAATGKPGVMVGQSRSLCQAVFLPEEKIAACSRARCVNCLRRVKASWRSW